MMNKMVVRELFYDEVGMSNLWRSKECKMEKYDEEVLLLSKAVL